MGRISLGGRQTAGRICLDRSQTIELDENHPDPSLPPIEETLPLVWLRERVPLGFDNNGNPTWTWADRVVAERAMTYEVRREEDDRAGVSTVSIEVRLAYLQTAPDIVETAMLRTEDGKLWNVSKIQREATSIVVWANRVHHE